MEGGGTTNEGRALSPAKLQAFAHQPVARGVRGDCRYASVGADTVISLIVLDK